MSSEPKSPPPEPPPHDSDSHQVEPPQPKKSFLDRLPPWVATNIRSRQSQKMLFRCWLGSWAALILLLPNKTLSTMGNASFPQIVAELATVLAMLRTVLLAHHFPTFGTIFDLLDLCSAFFAFLVSFFLPPSLPVQIFLFGISTLIMGVLLGWAIGAAGMKAATASREKVLLKTSLQKAQETAAGSANPDQVFKIEIFQGVFLDIRSSVVFGVFLGIGSLLFAAIRAYYKSLIFMSVFGTIAIDIFCTIGPLFPFAQYNILNSLLIPVSIYIAIAVVVTIFVFPRTAHHAFLGTVTLLLGQMKVLLDAQEDLLTSVPGSIIPGSPKALQWRATRVSMFTTYQGMAQLGKFLNAEFSWGRWNGDDARQLEEPLLMVISRLNGLMNLVKYLSRNPFIRKMVDSGSIEESSQSSGLTDTFLLQQMYQLNEAGELGNSLRLVDLVPLLREATFELRSAASDALSSVSHTVNFVNTTRWRNTADALIEQEHRLDAATERLRETLAEFKTTGRLRLLKPFEPHLGTERAPLRGLYVCYVFSTSIVVVSEAILTVAETLRKISSKRRKNRLWAPKGLRQLAHAFFVEKSTEGDLRIYGEAQEVKEIDPEGDERNYRRDPDSRPPTNVLQKVMNGLHVIYQWAKTPEALFIFRYVFISIALWVPAVVRKTAHFYYVQKGIWALIMAQTTLTIFAGDQLYGSLVRLTGTFVGLILGVLVWYIGNAHGRGNAYGTAASVGILLVPLMFIRLFAPPQYLRGIILMLSTFALIIGYSWIDDHLPVLSNVGTGWQVAWKRWTLVIIGFAASFIVMLFPAKSARKAVRLGSAKTLTSLSHIYASLMAAWITDIPTSKELKSGSSAWASSFRNELTVVALQLKDLKETAESARWEGNVRGHWPYGEYNRVIDVQQEMIASLAQLAGALANLDDEWRSGYLRHTKVVNPNFISDVMSVFSLVAQSLRTGEPMHVVLPQSLLDRLLYHDIVVQATPRSGGIDHLHELRSLEYLFYATAVIGVLQIIELLDELHSITRNLCGEVPFRGFEQWRDVHQRAHVSAPTA